MEVLSFNKDVLPEAISAIFSPSLLKSAVCLQRTLVQLDRYLHIYMHQESGVREKNQTVLITHKPNFNEPPPHIL